VERHISKIRTLRDFIENKLEVTYVVFSVGIVTGRTLQNFRFWTFYNLQNLNFAYISDAPHTFLMSHIHF